MGGGLPYIYIYMDICNSYRYVYVGTSGPKGSSIYILGPFGERLRLDACAGAGTGVISLRHGWAQGLHQTSVRS